MATPNMGLTEPVVSVTAGPDWATQLNAALTLIDSHTHITGQGSPIPIAGLNINADLPMAAFNVTGLRSTRFNSQSAVLSLVTDLNCTYVVNGNLYFNDSVGNRIQMTTAGAVNTSSSGSITGMGSTTATATYAAGGTIFTFNSNTNTPANFAVGPLTIGRNAASPKTVTLAPNSSQAANYALTFPTVLPTVTSMVFMDSTGQLSTLPKTFVSSVQTGLGSPFPNTIPHGMGVVPAAVFCSVTNDTGVTTFVFTEGTHTTTNVVVTATSGLQYKVIAFA